VVSCGWGDEGALLWAAGLGETVWNVWDVDVDGGLWIGLALCGHCYC
jgi:hypothetical protein